MAGVRGQAGFDRPIPAALGVDDKGGGTGELQGAKRYLLVGLGRGGGGRRRFVDVRRRGGSEELDGEGVLVEDRSRGEAGELCESEVELMAGSMRAERPGRSGATVSSSSPAFGRAVVAFWRFGAGNWRGNEGKGMWGFPWC